MVASSAKQLYFVEIDPVTKLVVTCAKGQAGFLTPQSEWYPVGSEIFDVVVRQIGSACYDPTSGVVSFTVDLPKEKARVVRHLKTVCDQSIAEGFEVAGNWFSCSVTDQLNYGRYYLLRDSFLTVTLKNSLTQQPVVLTTPQLVEFFAAMNAHITTKLTTFATYRAQIEAITDLAQLPVLLRLGTEAENQIKASHPLMVAAQA